MLAGRYDVVYVPDDAGISVHSPRLVPIQIPVIWVERFSSGCRGFLEEFAPHYIKDFPTNLLFDKNSS